jgi:hypothetical protein
MGIHKAELLVPESSPFQVEIAVVKKLKNYKLPGSYQIPAELIQAGGEILWAEIYELINSIWNKQESPDQWKESISAPVYKIRLTVVIIVGYHYYQLHTKFVILISRLSPYIDEIILDHECGFRHKRSVTDQIFCIRWIWGGIEVQ